MMSTIETIPTRTGGRTRMNSHGDKMLRRSNKKLTERTFLAFFVECIQRLFTIFAFFFFFLVSLFFPLSFSFVYCTFDLHPIPQGKGLSNNQTSASHQSRVVTGSVEIFGPAGLYRVLTGL
jgi:hypothetical protein